MPEAIILYLAIFIGILPVFFFKYKKKQGYWPEVGYIEPLLWLIAFSSFYELVFTIIFRVNSDFWFRLYLLLEFLALYYYFFRLLKKRFRLVFYFFLAVFSGTFIYLMRLWGQTNAMQTDSYLSVIEAVFVFTATILWFRDIFTHLEVESLWQSPAFYFISGFVLYFSGTFFLFLMSYSIILHKQISFEEYWMLNVLMCLLMRLFLIIGIWKGLKK